MDTDKYSFKLSLQSRPSVSQGTETREALASFLAESLGFIPSRGKGLVAVKLIELFSDIAGKREHTINLNGKELPIKNGAIKVEDIHQYLKEHNIDIGIAQLYNTYITNLLRARLITKKKYSMYGLKSNNLESSLVEVEREHRKEFEKILEHAVKLDKIK